MPVCVKNILKENISSLIFVALELVISVILTFHLTATLHNKGWSGNMARVNQEQEQV